MILNDKNVGTEKVIIKFYNPTIHGKQIKANIINIYSENEDYLFSFYTTISYVDLNKLETNKQINLITGNYDFVDENDFLFVAKDRRYILETLNGDMFITKIADNKFVLDINILDIDNNEVINPQFDKINYKTLKIHTTIDFNDIKE